MEDYRVSLDIYNGPLDLLLYLIRRDEVDIYDIPVAKVTEQYLAFLEVLKDVDPNLTGEFLVMAATLLEIKTRMLLPSPPPEEGGEASAVIDPRTELVRQLLQYKAFKDAAGDLAASAEAQAMKFPRRPAVDTNAEPDLDIEEVQVWDLLDAFSRLMVAIGKGKPQHEVVYDDTPVELHADDILDRLQREGPMTFTKIFEGRTTRSEIVGLFLALLELVRQKKIFATQPSNFGDIQVSCNPAPPTERPAEFAQRAAESETDSWDAGETDTPPASEQAQAPSFAGEPVPTVSEAEQVHSPAASQPPAGDPAAKDEDEPEDDLGIFIPDIPDLPDLTEPEKEKDHDAGSENQGTGT